MVENELIELISPDLVYFTEHPSKYYPGFREGKDYYLAVTFDKDSGELHSIHSLYDKTSRSDWNYIDKNKINPLDLQHLYEDLFLIYKNKPYGLSSNVLEYLLKEKRISKEFFNSFPRLD